MLEKEKAIEFDLIKQQISQKCAFSLGEEHILSLEPTFNRLEVLNELEKTDEAFKLVIHDSGVDFSGVRDLTDYLKVAQRDGVLQPNQLLDISYHSYAAQRIKNYLHESEIKLEKLLDFADNLFYSIDLSKEIDSCINQYAEMKKDASAKLAGLYRSLKQIQDSIRSTMTKIVNNNRDKLMEDIITTRNDRQVILVKLSYKNNIAGLIHGESSSGQAVYIEPQEVVVLNNQLMELNQDISKEELRILFELSQKVKSFSEQFLLNLQVLSELDALMAKAQWMKDNDAIIPDINEDGQLYIKQARHPLIDIKVVVRNTYRIQPPYRTLLITGPNTGGKTVTLKTIGLFVWMAHSGIGICAEGADIPLVDNLFIDIGDNQSIVESLSTFSARLKKQADICDNVTARSLVLLDELGGGTDPKEGESLAVAIIEYLMNRNSLVVATTHLSGLKAYGKTKEGVLVASVEFDLQDLKPTYRFLEGFVGQSNALEIAKRYGFNNQIIERAYYYLDSFKTDDEKLLEKIEEDKIELINERRNLNEKEKELSFFEAELIELRSELESKERELEEYKTSKLNEIIESTVDEMEVALTEMKRVKTKVDLDKASNIIKTTKSKLKEVEETVKQLEVGDIVTSTKANYQGEIISINKNIAEVLVNGIKVSVKLRDLKFKKHKEVKKQVNKVNYDRYKTVAIELNLIGMRVQEALEILDKHLDDCLYANAPFTRIIHGIGTGKLKEAVINRLKSNKHVKSFEQASLSEGGAGATIAKFA